MLTSQSVTGLYWGVADGRASLLCHDIGLQCSSKIDQSNSLHNNKLIHVREDQQRIKRLCTEKVV